MKALLSTLKELSNKINKEKDYTLKGGFVFVKTLVVYTKDSELINLTKREKEFINLLIENKIYL